MKVCSECRIEKDQSQFYSRQSRCKDCSKAYQDRYRKANPERIKEYRRNNAEHLKAAQVEYRRNNAECLKAKASEYRQKNAERIKLQRSEYHAEYYRKNAEQIKAKSSEWYRNNPEQAKEKRSEYYRKNSEKLIAAVAEWRQENPEKRKAQNAARYRRYPDKYKADYHTRRSRMGGASGRFTAEQIQALGVIQQHKCANPACRKSIKKNFHRDHMQPLACGGSNSIENIQLLCPSCNLKKNAMPYADWCRETGQLCFLSVN